MIRHKVFTVLQKAYRRLTRHRRQKHLRQIYNHYRENYYKYLVKKQVDSEATKVSIIVPCFNTPEKYFRPLLDSIFGQGYGNWELIVVDASSDPQISSKIKRLSKSDTRIVYKKVKNEGIAANTNVGLSVSTGDLVAFLDHDDLLDPDALAENVEIFNKHPNYDVAYSDEDKVSEDGDRFFDPHYKPGFSLDMLRNVNYITHFVVVKREAVDKVDGISLGFDGAQDYDFLLKLHDSGAKFAHIPKVLYHWREAENSTAADFSNKKNVLEAGCNALNNHYKRSNVKDVRTVPIENRPGFYRPIYKLDNSKRAIWLDIGNLNLTKLEIKIILEKYKELVSKYAPSLDLLTERPGSGYKSVMHVKKACLPVSGKGEILNMFGLAEEVGVAAVSPKLTIHGKIQSMGVVKSPKHKTKRLFHNLSGDGNDFFGLLEWIRNVDELEAGIIVSKTNIKSSDNRKVIFSRCDFTELRLHDSSMPISEFYSRDELEQFYNPNISELSHTTFKPKDYIYDMKKED